jgi:glutamine synthetase
MHTMLYTLYPARQSKSEIIEQLKANPNIKFVSLVAVDLGNNHTDEKIPINLLLEDYDQFMKNGIQTDGSSVYLPKIAEINNAKVDLIPDSQVRWLVDYNAGHIDSVTKLPVGTLLIPAFLKHEGIFVDSRAILKAANAHFESEIKSLIANNSHTKKCLGLEESDEIEKVILTTATELEFWVKTPDYTTDIEKLSTSQSLKEQYWKRTVGPVRTALEKTLIMLNHYDYDAEMAHKEVGGVPAKLKSANDFSHVMEQLEVDWKYDVPMQTADNELFSRDIISDIFVKEGLEVTFLAKPIEGVAGSGEHHHIGAAIKLKSGRIINLFSAQDMSSDYMNTFGYGAFMGILKNYEVINPFVTSSNDAFNRLKPGFEAPVCIVGSLGHTPQEPSRNRTVLMGLVRDIENPRATRFELRAPNPTSNTYLLTAACYQGMLDGIRYAIESKKTPQQLLAELRKSSGEPSDYLEKDRMYTSEEDVFEHYTAQERDQLFSVPPRNVFENLEGFKHNAHKINTLMKGQVFRPEILISYEATLLSQWITELRNRILVENVATVRNSTRLHKFDDDSITDYDVVRWEAINALRKDLMKDSLAKQSIFSALRHAIDHNDYSAISGIQLEMSDKISQLNALYAAYRRNLFNI